MQQTTTIRKSLAARSIATHLSFDGLINARHLGGYPTASGGKTKATAYLRCESMERITKQDADALSAFGIDTVLDLRSAEEVQAAPNPLAKDIRFCYQNLSVFHTDASPAAIAKSGMEMGDLYVQMLDDCQTSFRAIFRTLLTAANGVVFHCSAGKDRTGVLAALLLLLSGVSEEDVVREYCYTEVLLTPLAEKLKQNLPQGCSEEAANKMLAARAEFMEQAIAHLNRVYGGAEGYLSALGLTPDEISALRDRLSPQQGQASR